jgi:hypothetical protein
MAMTTKDGYDNAPTANSIPVVQETLSRYGYDNIPSVSTILTLSRYGYDNKVRYGYDNKVRRAKMPGWVQETPYSRYGYENIDCFMRAADECLRTLSRYGYDNKVRMATTTMTVQNQRYAKVIWLRQS